MAERTVIPSNFIPAVINIIAAGTVPVIRAQGKRITIWQLWLYNTGAQNIQFLASGKPLVGPLTGFPATAAISLPFTGAPHFSLSPGDDFQILTSAATQLSGFINYLIEE